MWVCTNHLTSLGISFLICKKWNEWVQSPNVPLFLKIYNSGKKNPRICFMYLLVWHRKTYKRNFNVRKVELILQCFSQYLESRCPQTSALAWSIILWISGFPAMQDPWFYPWVGKIPWRRKWLTTPVFLPGEFHRQPGRLLSMGLQRVRHNWMTNTQQGWCGTIQGQAGRDIPSLAYLSLRKALVTMYILKQSWMSGCWSQVTLWEAETKNNVRIHSQFHYMGIIH